MARWLVLVLIDIPALIVDLYVRIWTVVVAIGALAAWSAVMVALVLWFGLGIRWGW